ncbi:MAG: amidohydrolase family protein, partial [Solirubrobacteraceae bacterium]
NPPPRARDRVRESGGTLAARARLDPADDPTTEARRCLDGGAAGIKLHPRGEGFELADSRLDEALTLADERRGLVMVHAGEGVEGLGRQTLDRARQFSRARFVLADCAITDLAWIWKPAAELQNLYFDTSWWNPSDILGGGGVVGFCVGGPGGYRAVSGWAVSG